MPIVLKTGDCGDDCICSSIPILESRSLSWETGTFNQYEIVLWNGTEWVFGFDVDCITSFAIDHVPTGMAFDTETGILFGEATADFEGFVTISATGPCGTGIGHLFLSIGGSGSSCTFSVDEDAGGVAQSYTYDVSSQFIIEHDITIDFGVIVAGQDPPVNSWRLIIYADGVSIYDSGCTTSGVSGATATVPEGTTELVAELIDCAGDPEGNAVFSIEC